MIASLLAEYREPELLLRAINTLRAKGYSRIEVYTPYPLPGVDTALGGPRSRLPLAVLAGGLFGAGGAYFLEWLLNAYLYPINVGNRPPHFPLAYVPIAFEMGVLFASLTAFFGVLAGGRLLRLWHPVFEAKRFESATNDAYWIEVSASDRHFHLESTREDLRRSGATFITTLEGAR